MAGYRFIAVSAALGFAWVSACSPKAGSTDANGANQGSGANNGSGANSGLGANNGQGAGLGSYSDGGPGLGLGMGAGSGNDSGAGSDAKCAGIVLAPETIQVEKKIPVQINCTADTPQPITLYIMLDNSGSMSDNNKWTDAVSAITSFVKSDPTLMGKPWACVDKDGKSVPPPADLPPPGSGSISVAIQYFHPQNAGNRPDECSGVAHRTPAVPVGPIPANGGAITTSLAGTGPNGNTPTVGALTGGTDFCTAYQAANPDQKCVLVLVTDGAPNACGLSANCPIGSGNNGDCVDPKSASVLTPIASNAFTNPTDSVITFTLGMNGVTAAGFDLLNQIAIAGGSDCTPGTPGNEACNLTTGGSQGFLDALNTIRKSVQVTTTSNQTITTTVTQTSTLPCQWSIPTPTSGQKFDKDHINITVSTTSTTETLGQVPTLAACPASGGWYYDVPAAPTRILTCPSTCTSIQSAADTKVSVVVGCKTEPAVLH
jgi:hypothetical protein